MPQIMKNRGLNSTFLHKIMKSRVKILYFYQNYEKWEL